MEGYPDGLYYIRIQTDDPAGKEARKAGDKILDKK
jgi:hypothetical protein